MAHYDIKYNPSLVPQTNATQKGNVEISYPGPVDYTQGGWYGGYNDTNSYIVLSDTTSTSLSGRSTGGGLGIAPSNAATFWKVNKDDTSILNLINRLPGSPSNFSTAANAMSWVNANPDYGLVEGSAGPSNDGTTQERAGDSAYQIKTDFPSSADGLYWIKNNNINDATPFQIYADMTTNGGGWTLLLTNQNTAGWTYSNSILLNESNPVLGGSNYSIVAYADYLKSSGTTFQYMIDANQRNQFGGIWSAPSSYTFLKTDNTQIGITLDIKFGTWNYNNGGIEQYMPWRSTSSGLLTTSENSGGEWWGTLVTNGGWSPAPWISSDCGLDGCMPNPGIIWYWVR